MGVNLASCLPRANEPSAMHLPPASEPQAEPIVLFRTTRPNEHGASPPEPSQPPVEDSRPSPVKTFKGHRHRVLSVSFLPSGQEIVSASYDGSIRTWNIETGEESGDALLGHEGEVYSVALLLDGQRLVSGGIDRSIRVWDLGTRELVGRPWEGHSKSVSCVDVSPDSRFVASASYDSSVSIWDLDSGEKVFEEMRCEDWVDFVKFSRDGSKLVTCSRDTHVRIWDWREGTLLVGPMEGHEGDVRSAVWTLDDKQLISAGNDSKIRRWDSETGESMGEPVVAHKGAIYHLALSSDGRILASVSADETAKLWDASTLELLATIWHECQPISASFSPDNKLLAIGCDDRLIYLWNVPQLEGDKQSENDSFLDLPATAPPGENPGTRGAQTQSLTIEDLFDFPAPSWLPQNGPAKPVHKKCFLDRLIPRRRQRPPSEVRGGTELQESRHVKQGRLRAFRVAAAKAKKFIVVVGNGPRRRTPAENEENAEEEEEEEEEEEPSGEQGNSQGAVVAPDSDSDSDSVHGCCWRCCHWVCYEMVTCYL
ncbi:hypothetical protein HYDPIDRAFT_119567 [Hydnomerulius pinastri MD-312]|uniref:WD40 repeat-like protein n=1 Tax=Hydnomerulius pinastri MD-312 TaxID=994086 RepID=A0A0C9VYC4_9AGAM|nr:hypothetical protein HYDPIDRAFT_119567 [Hydnomerulius pinastri MD-312]